MDITSPALLKLKGILFLFLGVFAGALLLIPQWDLRQVVLFVIAIWGFCRSYYCCFYVLHHYADPSFKYAGLYSVAKYLVKGRSGTAMK